MKREYKKKNVKLIPVRKTVMFYMKISLNVTFYAYITKGLTSSIIHKMCHWRISEWGRGEKKMWNVIISWQWNENILCVTWIHSDVVIFGCKIVLEIKMSLFYRAKWNVIKIRNLFYSTQMTSLQDLMQYFS